MTLVVPFDGSRLAEAALARATEFGTVLETDVLAVTVIPAGNAEYARDRDWIGADDSFDLSTVVSGIRSQVRAVSPEATFEHVLVDRYAPTGTIATRVRRFARKRDASMVFIGSENAGHLVAAVSSVGRTVASDDAYDVVIVRHPERTESDASGEPTPYRNPTSASDRDE